MIEEWLDVLLSSPDVVAPPRIFSLLAAGQTLSLAAGQSVRTGKEVIWARRQSGELRYGLDYPDVKDRFVSEDDFAQWLVTHRQQGRVSLVMLLSKRDDISRANLPQPDNLYIQGRLALLEYLPK